MCLVIAPIYLAAAAAVMAAGTAYQSSQNSKNQADYQGKVQVNNQRTAEWQAADAKTRGDAEAAQTRRKYAALQSTQRASFTARGLDISDGSANAILTDTEFFGQTDENMVKANAARNAWGYKVQASNFAGSAAAFRATSDGQNPLLSGAMAGATSYLGSSTVDPRWSGSSRG